MGGRVLLALVPGLALAQRTIASEVSTNQGSPRGNVYVLVFDQLHIMPGNEQRKKSIRHKLNAIQLTTAAGIVGVLELFARNRGRILTRDQLVEGAWGVNTFVSERVVDNHIGNLRKKIEPDADHPRYLLLPKVGMNTAPYTLARTGLAAAKKLIAEGYDFDLACTSVLKRAIWTLWHALDELDRTWLPIVNDWRLNERHYGALQGLNKAETAKKFGEEQVKVWRRAYATPPPALTPDDERHPGRDPRYAKAAEAGLDALIATNTTVARPAANAKANRPSKPAASAMAIITRCFWPPDIWNG